MKTLVLVTIVVSLQGLVHSTPIPSYNYDDEGNIKNNLIVIPNESIEGLYPPKTVAKNHYDVEERKSSPEVSQFIVEITRYSLSFQTEGFPAEKVALKERETEGIQKLSLAFVNLLNNSTLALLKQNIQEPPAWSEVNPVITLTSSGLTIRFVNESKPAQNLATEEDSKRQIFWDFLTKYTQNIYQAKLQEYNLTETDVGVTDDELPFQYSGSDEFGVFLRAIWRTMRVSINFAENFFNGWKTTTEPDVKEKKGSTTSDVEEDNVTTTEEQETTQGIEAEEKAEPTTPEAEEKALASKEVEQEAAQTTPEVKERTRSTIATLFAFEEPSPFHVFPAQEFETRRRDIDSMFYGRGII